MVRLILGTLLFLASLLTICGAPEYHLWLLAVVVTEYPLIFVVAAIGLIIWSVNARVYRLPAIAINCLALFLFISPVVRAYTVAEGLPAAFDKAFDTSISPVADAPFSFTALLKTTPAAPLKTIVYDSTYHLTFDYYQDRQRQKRPCLIVIHGGSWSSGDSRQLPELNSYLAARGYNVASINYRLAPAYKNPAAVQDVRHLLAYLRSHSADLSIDTARFVLLGRSAGAQIALLAAYEHPDAGVRGVIDYYGPADMVWGYSIPASPLIMDSRKVMRNYLGGPYDKIPKRYAASSPIRFAGPSSVPTLIIYGDNDVLVSPLHSVKLDSALTQYHVRHLSVHLPWATHGFDFNLNGPGGQISRYLTLRFMNEVTK